MERLVKFLGLIGLILAVVLYNRFKPSTSSKNQVPVQLAMIDLSKIETDFDGLSSKIGKAMREVGFAYLINIPGFDPDELLAASKWFFHLPQPTKDGLAKSAFQEQNLNLFRGYYPVIPGGTSFKEAFEVGEFFDNPLGGTRDQNPRHMRDVLTEGNVWPTTEDSKMDQKFRTIMEDHFWIYSNASKTVMSLIANHLGFPKNHFTQKFHPGQLSTFRLLHYPDRRHDEHVPEEAKDGNVRITTAEHFDSSLVTLLATFTNPGLQIDINHDGNWQDVPPIKTGLVMNIGKLLADMIGSNQMKATYHRVLDLGTSRYSVPFFYEFSFDTDVSKDIYGNQMEGYAPGVKYSKWMTNRTSMFAEYATTNWGIAD